MAAALNGIVINEVLADPNGSNNFDTDGNLTADALDEFVELHNPTGSQVDISGYQLWDSGTGNWFTFPGGTILQPGASAMVMTGVQSGGSLPGVSGNNLVFDAARGSAVLNNSGDNLVLYDPGSDSYIQAVYGGDAADDPTTTYTGFSATATQSGAVDDFGAVSEGLSQQRFTDGSDTIVTGTPTPAAENACFTAGTLIATPDGEVPVEALVPGDMVLTADNRPVPVLWVGRQAVSTRFQPAERLMPVRFARGALGDGLPHADLTVTADHAMLVAGVLCNAGALVNGTTITRVPLDQMGDRYTVYHVETEAHEIILANGAPAETFIDNVSRRVFDNFAEFDALYGDVPEMEELPLPRALSARQVPATLRRRLGIDRAA